jgi:hypothetical protein
MRIFTVAIISLLLGACASADNNIHVLGSRSWAQTPTVPEGMRQRVEESAIEFQQHAPVPRIGLFDIAFPSSATELRDTDGYGVLLITALSQDENELPPKRLFVTLDGREHALRLISSTRTPPTQSPNVERVLGANRWDALYLFPVYLMQDGAALSMDFAENRDGFVLGKFSTESRDALGYDMLAGETPISDNAPSDAIMRMVAREYPGFLDTRAP